jgi:hypothetical protein
MPDNSEAWDSSHSQQALIALDEFLKVYLLEYAQMSAEEITHVLSSRIEFNGDSILLIPEDCAEAIELARRRLGMRFEYLEHNSPRVRVSIATKPFVEIMKRDENT